jgi:ankyrin repeat protein
MSKFIRVASAWISVLLIVSPGMVSGNKRVKDQNEEWKLVSSYGFPVWVASNFVIAAPAFSHRTIYLLIDGKNFTEENIRKLFTSLAAEFSKPHTLWIYAYSDRAVVQKAVDKSKGPIVCVAFANSPEGRRGSRNYSISNEPKRSGYYRAQYFRFSDGREEIEYSPHHEQEHVLKIDLRNPSPAYSGDLNRDLLNAVETGDVDKVNALLEHGADVNATGSYGNSALTMAAWKGQLDVVQALLEKGAEVNVKDNNGFSPLMTAAMDGGREIVHLLLDKGAEVSARTGSDGNRLDDTVLMLASLHGHVPIVEQLLTKGANVNERNRFGETALMQAALAGFPEVELLLAMHGADVNATDVDGRTALMLSGDDKATVEMLLNLGADYKRMDKAGMTPLMLAAIRSQSSKVDALVFAGAGKESIEATKAYIAAPPIKDAYPGYRKEEGYRILTEIYVRMGLKKEAVESSKQALDILGDKAHLRARLGFTYVAVGDRESALVQYRILKEGVARAQDDNTKRLYKGWRDALFEQLNK